MKNYLSVIFDLDGTLLDTLEDLGDAVNRVLVERGFSPHPVDAYRYFVGDGSKILVERALPEHARRPEILEDCLASFMADYDKSWKVKTRLYEGISEMLDSLTAMKIKLAILSNKSHVFTVACVKDMLGKWNFEAVLGLREDVPKKPDPAGAIEAAQILGTDPERILYLGDTGVDMQTAVSAGMFPVGVLWGFRTREELLANGAKKLIEHPKDLLDFMGDFQGRMA